MEHKKIIQNYLRILRSTNTYPISYFKDNPKKYTDALLDENLNKQMFLFSHEKSGGYALLTKADLLEIVSACPELTQKKRMCSLPAAIRLRVLRDDFSKICKQLTDGEIHVKIFSRKVESSEFVDFCLLSHNFLFELLEQAAQSQSCDAC